MDSDVISEERQVAREELLADYAAGPRKLTEALVGLTPEEIGEMNGGSGEWSVKQIIHHISDGDDLWKMVIKAAIGDPGCRFDASWYIVGNGWAGTLDYAGRSPDAAYELFESNRRHIVQLIEHYVDSWDRSVTFTLGGVTKERVLTVEEVVRWQVTHTQQHIDDIWDLRQKYGRI
jgi:uncharacterized damage-inducible protein DinB